MNEPCEQTKPRMKDEEVSISLSDRCSDFEPTEKRPVEAISRETSINVYDL